MTREEFESAAFFKGQKAIFDGILPVSISAVDFDEFRIVAKTPSNQDKIIPFAIIELFSPDPLAILREILRRIADPTGEPTACRLDPDLLEKIKRLFENEQV